MPTATASSAAWRPSASSRPRDRVRRARPEPGAQRRDRDRARDVRVVELLIRADVDQHRALVLREPELARRERQQLDARSQQRPAVEVDDRVEVRRLGPEPRQRGGDELVLVGDGQGRVVRALEADGRGDLEVHARPAAQRAAQVTGPQLHRVGQAQEAAVERAEDPARTVGGLDGQIRARHVVDEERVARQQRPGVLAAPGVDQGEGGVLGAVSGRVNGLDAKRAKVPGGAVVEGIVLVGGGRQAMHVDRRARRGGQPAMAGDVVGVVVGLEDVLDSHAQVAGQLEVLVDVEARVDDGGHTGLVVADEIGRAAEVFVDELAEDHAGPNYVTRTPRMAMSSRGRRSVLPTACSSSASSRAASGSGPSARPSSTSQRSAGSSMRSGACASVSPSV